MEFVSQPLNAWHPDNLEIGDWSHFNNSAANANAKANA